MPAMLRCIFIPRIPEKERNNVGVWISFEQYFLRFVSIDDVLHQSAFPASSFTT